MTGTVVTTHALSKAYGRFEALKPLNLSVPAGSVFALVGTNGAGKTTTLRLLLNMIAPTRGTATVLGVDSRRLSPTEWAQIGYVAENQRMPGRMRVASYIRYLRPFYPSWDPALESTILEQLQLPPDRRIKDLSHGMRLKMALACALPFRPRLLMLDEPFSGLDPLVREEFMQGLLRRTGETTIVISSHELSEIEDVTTHIALIDRGTLIHQGAIETIRRRVRHIRITCDATVIPMPRTPCTWIDVRADGPSFSCIDTDCVESEVEAHIRALFTGVQCVDMETLPLRSIVTALVRRTRGATA